MFDERDISKIAFNAFSQDATLIRSGTFESLTIKVVVDRGIEQWNATGSTIIARDQVTSLVGNDSPARGDYLIFREVVYEIRNRISSDNIIVVLEAVPLGDEDDIIEKEIEFAI